MIHSSIKRRAKGITNPQICVRLTFSSPHFVTVVCEETELSAVGRPALLFATGPPLRRGCSVLPDSSLWGWRGEFATWTMTQLITSANTGNGKWEGVGGGLDFFV